MRVLVLIEQSAPSRYWEAALPLLTRKGIEVHFATVRARGPLSDALEQEGIPVTAFGARSAKGYPAVAFKLSGFLIREKVDIVHACESIPAAISGIVRPFAGGIRLFHRQHNACPQNTKLFHDLANKMSDFMMACSGSTMRYACEIDGFPESRAKVAYNGIVPLRNVSQDETGQIKSSFDIPSHAKIVSIVARLRNEKGHLTLFEAAVKTAAKLPVPLHVIVVGTGYYESEIRDAASLSSGIKVHFAGHHEDIAPWFAVADLAAMPSYSEPFGLVAVEAMSSGRPLVASGVDGLLEVVEDGVSGILVPPKDADALSDAMLSLFKSPDISATIAANAQKRVEEKFTMERMVDGWIDCYNWALQRQG